MQRILSIIQEQLQRKFVRRQTFSLYNTDMRDEFSMVICDTGFAALLREIDEFSAQFKTPSPSIHHSTPPYPHNLHKRLRPNRFDTLPN